jgi:hypothetical protein
MLVELGFVGTFIASLLAIILFRVVFRMSRKLLLIGGDITTLAALLAFLSANVMAFSVAFQVYGDPLIGILLGFSLGLILSGSRLAAQRLSSVRDRAKMNGVLRQEDKPTLPVPVQ